MVTLFGRDGGTHKTTIIHVVSDSGRKYFEILFCCQISLKIYIDARHGMRKSWGIRDDRGFQMFE